MNLAQYVFDGQIQPINESGPPCAGGRIQPKIKMRPISLCTQIEPITEIGPPSFRGRIQPAEGNLAHIVTLLSPKF
uniref:Uncharacterized protein n=1 Tax=Oryza brachyantha TaxID=4533 RepID=J3N3A4_ORYBR